jgi:hypothetical protein
VWLGVAAFEIGRTIGCGAAASAQVADRGDPRFSCSSHAVILSTMTR